MSTLKYNYSSIPELCEDQNYNYIEKTILSVLQEQKVSFKQTKEIFNAIELRLTEKLENEFVSSIDCDDHINQNFTIQNENVNVSDGATRDQLKSIANSLSKIATKGIDIYSSCKGTNF